MGGGDNNVDAWSRDVQRIDRHRSGISAGRTRLLVDDDADAARQRDGNVRVGDEYRLARDDQADELGIPGDCSLSIAAGGTRVRFHEIGSHQTTQQAQIVDRRLRLTAGATARRGAAEHVSRDQTQNVDTGQRRLQIPAACRKRSSIGQRKLNPHCTCPQSHGLTAERGTGLRKTGGRAESQNRHETYRDRRVFLRVHLHILLSCSLKLKWPTRARRYAATIGRAVEGHHLRLAGLLQVLQVRFCVALEIRERLSLKSIQPSTLVRGRRSDTCLS